MRLVNTMEIDERTQLGEEIWAILGNWDGKKNNLDKIY